MGYDEEIILLDNFNKGRKVPYPLQHCQNDYSQSYNNRKISDMLHTAMRKRQAIVKISSYGKGRSKVSAHLCYISRNGKLALENAHGEKIIGRKEQTQLLDSWCITFGTNQRSRDTINIILSTPAGSSPEATEKAARNFLSSEFGAKGHDYVFVAHADTANPHVHAVVKMMSCYGNKLNPRKADLYHFRAKFAETCREQCIDIEASPRYERGLACKSRSTPFTYMKRSHRHPRTEKILIEKIKQESSLSPHPAALKMLKRNQLIRKRYAEKAKQLAAKAKTYPDKNQRNKFLQAAKQLDQYAKTMPIEKMNVKYSNIQQLDKLQTLHQYSAVTQGTRDTRGIYQLSTEKVATSVYHQIAQQILLSNNLEKQTGLGLDR